MVVLSALLTFKDPKFVNYSYIVAHLIGFSTPALDENIFLRVLLNQSRYLLMGDISHIFTPFSPLVNNPFSLNGR